jgi:hypothetical protein
MLRSSSAHSLRLRRHDADDDGLGGRGAAAIGEVVDGDEDVGLREVGGGAAGGDVVGDDDEPGGDPGLAPELADDVDDLAVDQPSAATSRGFARDRPCIF